MQLTMIESSEYSYSVYIIIINNNNDKNEFC